MQGSGWGWLTYNTASGNLEYRWTKNQDTVADLSMDYAPLLGIDVWEHAYYLDYKNMRPTYLQEMWKIINWEVVEKRFEQASSQH